MRLRFEIRLIDLDRKQITMITASIALAELAEGLQRSPILFVGCSL